MERIQLLYVKNVINRTQNQVQQQLVFFILIENIGYDKQIEVIWAGEDGVWNVLPAAYHSSTGSDKEYWHTQITFPLTEEHSLPGNIQFGLRYRIAGNEYWDSNGGLNFLSEADSGIKLPHNRATQNISFGKSLSNEQQFTAVTFAVDQSINIEKVTIHWTIDNWNTTNKTPCNTKINYWDKEFQSNARNPNQYGTQLWTGQIKHGDAYRLEYSLCCEMTDGQTIWENNYGDNFALQREQLKILILNLHCYQEKNQDEKFTIIAKAINELDIDIVCLQEVAEYWKDGEGDWESNSAKIINDRLPTPFHLHTDWSHLGFDKYREGVAILSRFPLTNHESMYVSDSNDIYDIHSRKVVKAEVNVPCFGSINVFSAHLSWLEDGFQQQFQQLHHWAKNAHTKNTQATMLCGDFNITAGSSGYELVVDSDHYEDQFLAANDQDAFKKIFRVNDAHWHKLLSDDYRIDYIFMNKDSKLQVSSAKVLFTDQDYGMVSDHCGYLMMFEPKVETSEQNEAIK